MGKSKGISRKWQYVGLGALTAVTTVAVVGALTLHDSAERPVTAPANAFSVTTPTPTPTPTKNSKPDPGLKEIRALISGDQPLTISVLGDSTGNNTGEWVDLYAQHLSQYGTVSLYLWDTETESWLPDPTVYAGGPRQITIWNGSYPGAMADYPQGKLTTLQPEEPDMVLMNYGHNGMYRDLVQDTETTLQMVDDQWGENIPAAVIIQNPAVAPRAERSETNHDALQAWAEENGVPSIDVRSAFQEQPDLDPLLRNDGTGVHPNDAGQQVWVEAVISAIG